MFISDFFRQKNAITCADLTCNADMLWLRIAAMERKEHRVKNFHAEARRTPRFANNENFLSALFAFFCGH
jgi:hypothetical protein